MNNEKQEAMQKAIALSISQFSSAMRNVSKKTRLEFLKSAEIQITEIAFEYLKLKGFKIIFSLIVREFRDQIIAFENDKQRQEIALILDPELIAKIEKIMSDAAESADYAALYDAGEFSAASCGEEEQLQLRKLATKNRMTFDCMMNAYIEHCNHLSEAEIKEELARKEKRS